MWLIAMCALSLSVQNAIAADSLSSVEQPPLPSSNSLEAAGPVEPANNDKSEPAAPNLVAQSKSTSSAVDGGDSVSPPAAAPDSSPAGLAPVSIGEAPAITPDTLTPITPAPLPPEPVIDHTRGATLDIGGPSDAHFIQIANLRPIRLEATYNEPLSLRDALLYAVDHNLPIKISAENWNSQVALYRGFLGNMLPNFQMNYNLTHFHVFPDTEANSRVFNTTVSYPLFQGGRIFYGALSQYYRSRGWGYSYRASINDTLLSVYVNYMNLLLNRALLQIRLRSLETSQAQLRLNEQLYAAGTGTRFAVMQSRSQLALDRQALLLQQVAVRQSALTLATTLNMPLAINVVPVEKDVNEVTLVDEAVKLNDLMRLALEHRPELRQWEMFRLTAARQIQVAASSLYPTINVFGTYTISSTTVNGSQRGGLGGVGGGNAGNSSGGSFNGLTGANATGFSSPPGTVNPITIGAASSNATNPTNGTNVNVATNTTTTTNGTPNATVPSGGLVATSGVSTTITGANPSPSSTTTAASTPLVTGGTASTTPNSSSFAGTTGGGQVVAGQTTGAATTGFSQSGLLTPGSVPTSVIGGGSGTGGVFAGKFRTFSLGFQLNWTLPGLGVPIYEGVQSARALARQALLQANQELLLVGQQIRSAYLNALATRKQIDVAAAAVASSGEALRLANLRVQTGVGTNLELIQAQRDYITALVNQAQAIINSNQAQAQLLHDTGLISVETLTATTPRRISLK